MKVYYFTRTGRSEKIAQDIAGANNTVANKITDDINWDGAANFIKGGYMSSKKQTVPIEFEMPAENDDIILVFPLWASQFPPSILSFIDKIGRERITVVVTSLATKLKDRDGFLKVYDVVGKEIEPPKELL